MGNRIKYAKLSNDLQERIIQDRAEHKINPYKFRDEDIERRDNTKDKASLWRAAFVRDIEKILHLPFYNRYSDKTQVFSFYNNDDITRRGLHVQLVSRIARNIGKVLDLNLDLIEAIALGHDIGHTPFGHAGEKFLSELLYKETGRYFNHNVQSARVLDVIFGRNISLQTLDGVLCHNGELEKKEYIPVKGLTFEEYDRKIEECYVKGNEAIIKLVPSTLEGCVVRISDIIAYLGKDRQDAKLAKITDNDIKFSSEEIGTNNSAIINNLIVDIIEHSYGKNYIMISEKAYNDLKTAKDENYRYIYNNSKVSVLYEQNIKPMFGELYYKLLDDLKSKNENTIIYKHHIDYLKGYQQYYHNCNYLKEEPNQIVADYIASMTDDYFVDLHKKLFPNSKYIIKYKSYFGE